MKYCLFDLHSLHCSFALTLHFKWIQMYKCWVWKAFAVRQRQIDVCMLNEGMFVIRKQQ